MNTIPELIEDIKNGKMVIVIDDEDRENEGDIIIAADSITPELVNFMAKEARGLICLSLTESQIKKLGLSLMVKDEQNYSPNKTAFTVSIEAASGVTTGISAADRAHTIKVAVSPNSASGDLIVPGHIFPIMAQKGGVLKRAGHTEASVDLAALAGLNPAAVICEVMNSDGTMARYPDLVEFAKKHDIKIGTIEDLIKYRIETESFVKEKSSAELNSSFEDGFKVRVFENKLDKKQHLALTFGDIDTGKPVMVRVQRESILGDVFGCMHSNTGDQIKKSMQYIKENGSGVILYLRQEDMSNRLESKVEAYSHMDKGLPLDKNLMQVFKSDKRDYGVGAQILRALNIQQIKLITNAKAKRVGLKGYGLEIVDSVSLNQSYTATTVEHEKRMQ